MKSDGRVDFDPSQTMKMTLDQSNSSSITQLLADALNSSLGVAAMNSSSSPPGSTTSLGLLDDGVGGELDLSVIERFRSNRRVNDFAFFCLVAAYCVLIVFGTIGNSLVVYVVARQPAMRTARNVFVVNLAISDLLLCLITMPLTVGLSHYIHLLTNELKYLAWISGKTIYFLITFRLWDSLMCWEFLTRSQVSLHIAEKGQ